MVDGEGEAWANGGVGVAGGVGEAAAPAQEQSASSEQLWLTQRLVPPTV